jgi:nucleoside 2-deoxyribosyltransferase-like protein
MALYCTTLYAATQKRPDACRGGRGLLGLEYSACVKGAADLYPLRLPCPHAPWYHHDNRKENIADTMKYIEAPASYAPIPGERSLFLAGGISGCPDWQRTMVDLLADTALLLLNPRRADFPIHDPGAAEAQITWEYQHLRRAAAILFWFPCETLNPIVLYELGAWSMADKPLFVGVHPRYQRRQDVEIQTRLARPDVPVALSLEDLATAVRQSAWLAAIDDSR